MERIAQQFIITMEEIIACDELRDYLCTRRDQVWDPFIPLVDPPYGQFILYETECGKWYIRRPYKEVSFGSSSVTYPEAYIKIPSEIDPLVVLGCTDPFSEQL